ncbi:MAG: M48 family metalloprotease, partial [Planctomycetota bacterium]
MTADALEAADRLFEADWPVALPDLSRAGWPVAGSRDLLALGDDEVTGWLLAPVEPRPFTPAFALLETSSGWMSAYDRNRDGRFDVVILDEDGDLLGDRRWERSAAGDGWGTPYVGALDPLVSLTAWLPRGGGRREFRKSAINDAMKRLSSLVFVDQAAHRDEFSKSLLPATAPAPSAGPLSRARSPLVALVEKEFSGLCDAVRSLEDAPELADDLRVEVWDHPALNANCSGSTIRITLALIEALDRREDHLRAVLAHELAHSILKHGEDHRELDSVMAEALDVRHRLIRQAEFEADDLAADLLERIGESPEDLHELLIRLHRIQRILEVGWIQGVGGDHGSLMERLARLKPTDARAQALRAFERGTAFLECRRADRAARAFEYALEFEKKVPGGLDEVRFALARARLQFYHEQLPGEIRDAWLEPDFGPQLTVDDVLATRGGDVVPADVARWKAAMEEIDALTFSVDPAIAALLRGTALVLHPTGEAGQPVEGTEALMALIESDNRLADRRPAVFLAAVNNLALGLERTGRTGEACDLLMAESERAFDGAAAFFSNTARVAGAARDASAR